MKGTAPDRLRVAVVTESFLPSLNGVTTSVCRVLDHLRREGHEAMVICPAPAPSEYAGFQVMGVPALSYRQFPVGLPTTLVQHALQRFVPDVVHAASPFVLAAAGLSAARRLGVPTVAIYQTDIAGYARRHHVGLVAGAAWRWTRRVHNLANLTLAPSTAALDALREHGVPRLSLWGRGVDAELFDPARRDTEAVRALRDRLAPDDEVLVGYVGRLAPEKRVERLAVLAGMERARLVIVGDGPSRNSVERTLGPHGARLLGRLEGESLADTYAAMDLFVHTGTEETFGQTVQEAMASGLPVVAPAVGGPLDLVRNGVNGFLYPGEDDEALRVAVATLVGDDELRREIGVNSRAEVLPRSWRALCEQLVEHYRRVIVNRRRGGIAA